MSILTDDGSRMHQNSEIRARPVGILAKFATILTAAAFCIALSFAQAARMAAAAEANAIEAALRSISADEMQQCVNMLADESFEGRETGSRGGRAACAYIGGPRLAPFGPGGAAL